MTLPTTPLQGPLDGISIRKIPLLGYCGNLK